MRSIGKSCSSQLRLTNSSSCMKKRIHDTTTSIITKGLVKINDATIDRSQEAVVPFGAVATATACTSRMKPASHHKYSQLLTVYPPAMGKCTRANLSSEPIKPLMH